MFALTITRWLLGYVRFSIRGGSPERFLNYCARSGAYLWNIYGGVNSEACVLCGTYRSLRYCARRAGCRLRVQERHGFPFLLRRTRNHRGILAGACLFAIILAVLSSRIWCVELLGSYSMEPETVKSALANAGLYPGALKKMVDPKKLEQKIMLMFPEIGWMSINNRGCVMEVNIKEKKEAPQLIKKDKFCNITASKTAQILSMKVFAGTPVVKKGDAVLKGQLLVSAVVEDDTGGSTLVHSDAEILGETVQTLTEKISLRQEKTELTGNTLTRRRLDFFGVRLPLTLVGKPGVGYRATGIKTDIRLFGTLLPVGLYEEYWEQFKTTPFKLTVEQAHTIAEKEIEKKEEELRKCCKILSQKVTDSVNGDQLIYKVILQCEENIGTESEIFIKN